jgi:hypothetical protein
MAPGVTCTQCGGTDIELDAARGDAVCIQCGAVLEENTIVNEVTFAQDAGGGSSVVGQFVSATPGLRSAGLGFAKESREVAFSNGQRHISQLAAALRLAEHHQEAAQRLFMLAVQARDAAPPHPPRPPAGRRTDASHLPTVHMPTRFRDCPARQRLHRLDLSSRRRPGGP